jgi:hypothetical protein
MDRKQIEEYIEVCKQRTPGEWTPSKWGKDDNTPYTIDELKQLLCDMVDKTENHGDSAKWFFGIYSSVDPDGTPVAPALTGKGPTSEQNALFITTAANKSRQIAEWALELEEENKIYKRAFNIGEELVNRGECPPGISQEECDLCRNCFSCILKYALSQAKTEGKVD